MGGWGMRFLPTKSRDRAALQERGWRRAGLMGELALVVRLTDLKVRHSMGRAGTEWVAGDWVVGGTGHGAGAEVAFPGGWRQRSEIVVALVVRLTDLKVRHYMGRRHMGWVGPGIGEVAAGDRVGGRRSGWWSARRWSRRR